MIILEAAIVIAGAAAVWYVTQIVRAKIGYRKFKKNLNRQYHIRY